MPTSPLLSAFGRPRLLPGAADGSGGVSLLRGVSGGSGDISSANSKSRLETGVQSGPDGGFRVIAAYFLRLIGVMAVLPPIPSVGKCARIVSAT
jgi:hypothetical protein